MAITRVAALLRTTMRWLERVGADLDRLALTHWGC